MERSFCRWVSNKKADVVENQVEMMLLKHGQDVLL